MFDRVQSMPLYTMVRKFPLSVHVSESIESMKSFIFQYFTHCWWFFYSFISLSIYIAIDDILQLFNTNNSSKIQFIKKSSRLNKNDPTIDIQLTTRKAETGGKLRCFKDCQSIWLLDVAHKNAVEATQDLCKHITR